jgi:protein involved in polysaccharide export with SLBB domain
VSAGGRRLALTVVAGGSLVLGGCIPHWGRQAVAFDSDKAQAQLLADGQGGDVKLDPPEDAAPAILDEYRFAPGDRLDLRLFGHDEYDQPDSIVDPDGMLAFNLARGIPAAGKTVAELRAEIERRMSEYVRSPKAIVQPKTVVGHRFYVLGTVASEGSYPIDRPVRVLEAIAGAGGIETGLQNNATVEIANFDRSVLVRGGKYLPIDFRALIQEGDLRYNVLMWPGDLLIFPSTVSGEIYILGAVRSQGPQPFAPDLTLVGVITRRGGLLERAYRRQIAVLRGNLSRPRVYLVDIDDVLSAHAADFRIQPGDLIYVPDRPFQYLRELALAAAQSFVGVIGSRAGNQTADRLGF